MNKLLLPVVGIAMLTMTLCVYSQESPVSDEKTMVLKNEISEELSEAAPSQTDESLWEQTKVNLNLENLSVYLATFPNGKYASDARSKFQVLEEKASARVKADKQLEAYRKRKITGGLVLELDSKFTDVKPYVRSMLNSCGYKLVESHRFAKRVYPTLVIDGRMFNSKSDAEHAVTLDLALVLKTQTRKIKAREKMRSYRTSEVDAHQALLAAFEDVGAQMKSTGFCGVK